MTDTRVYRDAWHWRPLLGGRLLVPSYQFCFPGVVIAQQQLGVWYWLDEPYRSELLWIGVAIWRVFLMRQLESISNESSREPSVWSISILRSNVAVEVPAIQLSNILVGLCRMPSLHMWEIYTIIRLVSPFYGAIRVVTHSPLVRHTHR